MGGRKAKTIKPRDGNMDNEQFKTSLVAAVDWLIDVAQLQTDDLPLDTVNVSGLTHKFWKGAIRGEYSAADKQWHFFCPVWHTGQAVKALVMAYKLLKDEKYHQAAIAGAQFILNNQVWDEGSPDHGLILAFEDSPDKVNTSAVLECMHGLMLLADMESSEEMWKRIVSAGYFLLKKMFMPDLGLYRDVYDPNAHTVMLPNPYRSKDNVGGRPLLDDGIMLKLYEWTGDEEFLSAHIRVSETLAVDQDPPGNWLDYGPCNRQRGNFHPRQTYWWAIPLIDSYRKTGRKEFLDTAIASGEFCSKAMRQDGGYFRGYYTDGRTDSFGHATSGSACSAILFMELWKETRDSKWMDLAESALGFCQAVQFTNPQDPNLRGAILEKVLWPDGTDRSPYHIRDLGTIFFVIAGCRYLEFSDEDS